MKKHILIAMALVVIMTPTTNMVALSTDAKAEKREERATYIFEDLLVIGPDGNESSILKENNLGEITETMVKEIPSSIKVFLTSLDKTEPPTLSLLKVAKKAYYFVMVRPYYFASPINWEPTYHVFNSVGCRIGTTDLMAAIGKEGRVECLVRLSGSKLDGFIQQRLTFTQDEIELCGVPTRINLLKGISLPLAHRAEEVSLDNGTIAFYESASWFVPNPIRFFCLRSEPERLIEIQWKNKCLYLIETKSHYYAFQANGIPFSPYGFCTLCKKGKPHVKTVLNGTEAIKKVLSLD